jgi:hypothetical protein
MHAVQDFTKRLPPHRDFRCRVDLGNLDVLVLKPWRGRLHDFVLNRHREADTNHHGICAQGQSNLTTLTTHSKTPILLLCHHHLIAELINFNLFHFLPLCRFNSHYTWHWKSDVSQPHCARKRLWIDVPCKNWCNAVDYRVV